MLGVITSILVIVSVAMSTRRSDRRIGYLALTFVPFAVAAWLMLDRFGINRLSIGYCPMFAILAADGIARVVGQRPRVELAVGAVLIGCFVGYTLPALTSVRDDVSPTVLAVRAVPATIAAGRDELFVAQSMTPFIDWLLPRQPYVTVYDEHSLPLSARPGQRPWLLTDLDLTSPPNGLEFHRAHGRLWNITRRQYFDIALEPIRDLPELLSGWYPPERAGTTESRWMSAHSVMRIHPQAGHATLHLAFDVPDELMPQPPVITVTLNGAIIDRFQAPEAHLTRDYNVQGAANGARNVLELDVDRTLNPARQHLGDDARDLGLLMRSLSWGPG